MGRALVDAARRDWSHAVRVLRRTPGFTLVAVLILGLGIGMATAMLSVVNSALLQKLPVRDQDRLVVLWPVGKGGTEVPLDLSEIEKFRDNSHTLQGIAGFVHYGAREVAISDGDEPLHLRQALVTSNFFTVLGASPVLGRLLQPEDKLDAATHAMVISHSVWQRRFGGDRAVIGKQLNWRTAGWSYTIVGVAPPGLDFPVGTDYWAPSAPTSSGSRSRKAPRSASSVASSAWVSPGLCSTSLWRSLRETSPGPTWFISPECLWPSGLR